MLGWDRPRASACAAIVLFRLFQPLAKTSTRLSRTVQGRKSVRAGPSCLVPQRNTVQPRGFVATLIVFWCEKARRWPTSIQRRLMASDGGASLSITSPRPWQRCVHLAVLSWARSWCSLMAWPSAACYPLQACPSSLAPMNSVRSPSSAKNISPLTVSSSVSTTSLCTSVSCATSMTCLLSVACTALPASMTIYAWYILHR